MNIDQPQKALKYDWARVLEDGSAFFKMPNRFKIRALQHAAHKYFSRLNRKIGTQMVFSETGRVLGINVYLKPSESK
jgi:hypothetical protein